MVLPGVRRVAAQIETYTQWWTDQNDEAIEADGPLWIAIGDSTVLGIGASAADRGWVGRVAEQLRLADASWRVVNLAMSGARIDDVISNQLPVIETLRAAGHEPAIVTCCVGTNDVLWSRANASLLRTEVGELAAALPPRTLVATIAGSSQRVVLANRALKQAALDRDLVVVDPWREPGAGVRERLAEDRFHPNDVGHELMANAYLRVFPS